MNGTLISSGLQTDDGAIKSSKATLMAILITTGAASGEVALFDNASAASGKELFRGKVAATEDSKLFEFGANGVRADNGIYADKTGSGVEYIVYYR